MPRIRFVFSQLVIPGLLVLALHAAVVAPRAAHAQSCPASEYRLGGGGLVSSADPAADTTWAPPGYVGSFRAAWNLPAGTVAMSQCCSLLDTHVWARDAFDVTGVPSGTAVLLTAEFVVDGAVWTDGCGGTGCGGVMGARLRRGADSAVVEHPTHLFSGRADYRDVLQLPLTIVAGSPETIEYQVWGHRTPGGNHGAEGTGLIRFQGLPPGAVVVSCKGYGQTPTLVRHTTWGRLKSVYR
jgi:hypothetical protein